MSAMILFADITTFVAWWGAIIATGVLLWNIYKEFWRTGARFRIQARLNWHIVEDPNPGNTYVNVEVTNTGDQAANITKLCFIHYANWWYYLTRQTKDEYLILNTNSIEELPYRLMAGDTWPAFPLQPDEFPTMLASGILTCEIVTGVRKHRPRARVLDNTGGPVARVASPIRFRPSPVRL